VGSQDESTDSTTMCFLEGNFPKRLPLGASARWTGKARSVNVFSYEEVFLISLSESISASLQLLNSIESRVSGSYRIDNTRRPNAVGRDRALREQLIYRDSSRGDPLSLQQRPYLKPALPAAGLPDRIRIANNLGAYQSMDPGAFTRIYPAFAAEAILNK